jgi:hypothetical protein
MVYEFLGLLVESYGTWLLLQRLGDTSKDSDIPKNVPFALAINNRNTTDTAPPINTYCRHQDLDPQYHTFAVILQSNYVSPHQVILDADIDDFSHPEAVHALMRTPAKYPEEAPSDDDSA